MYKDIRVYYAVDMYTKKSSVDIKLVSVCYFIQHRSAPQQIYSSVKLKLFEQAIKTF